MDTFGAIIKQENTLEPGYSNTCVFCSRLLGNSEYELFSETTKVILGVLLLQKKINVSLNSPVCSCCMNSLEKAYNFKTTCLKASDNFASMNLESGLIGSKNICRFCRNPTKEDYISLTDILKTFHILEVIEKYIPELDIKPFEASFSCSKCQTNLNDFVNFIVYLDSQEESEEKFCSKGQITESTEEFKYTVFVKEEWEADPVIPKDRNDLEDVKEEGPDLEDHILPQEKRKEFERLMQERANIPHQGTTEKTNPKRKRIKQIQICEICSFATRSMYSHRLIHQTVLPHEMVQCPDCSFKTTRKQYLKTHMSTHEPVDESKMLKCLECSFSTKSTRSLNRHGMVHKTLTEEEMQKCPACDFKTKRVDHLKKHMVMHRDPSEIKMYECECCPYRTRHRAYLKRHMRNHEMAGDRKMRKCLLCSYQTRFNNHLNRHMKYHENVEENK